jgi:Pentapeptide repeats (9 copies)
MSTSPTTETSAPPPFLCDCGEWARSACEGMPPFGEHEGKRYCVLHYPCEEKAAAFRPALENKLAVGDFNFRRVWFPERAPLGRRFPWKADFAYAVFRAGADFSRAKFSGDADFHNAEFHAGTTFYAAAFNGDVYFHDAEFGDEADFSFAEFYALAYFRDVTFRAGANFEVAEFRGELRLTGVRFRAPAGFSLRGASELGDDDFNENLRLRHVFERGRARVRRGRLLRPTVRQHREAGTRLLPHAHAPPALVRQRGRAQVRPRER